MWTQRTNQLIIAKMQGGSGDSRNTQFTFNENTAMPAEEITQSSPGDTQTVVGYALPELHNPDGKLHQTGEEYPPKVHQDLLEIVLEVMLAVKGTGHLEDELPQGTDPPGP